MLESGVHIPSLDGKDIYISNSYLVPKVNDKGLKIGYKLRDQNGDLNLKRFINTLDYSLDLIKMQEVYESVYRRRDFSFNKNGKDYTQRVINVTFKYNNKAFNRIRNGVYVKFGYAYEELLFKDCIAMQDGVLVGIEVDIQVENPVPNDVLGSAFIMKMECIRPNLIFQFLIVLLTFEKNFTKMVLYAMELSMYDSNVVLVPVV